MRFDISTLLCLLAADLAHGLSATHEYALPTVASKDSSIALNQLAELAKFAKDQTESNLNTNSRHKRGICNPGNLSIRREWYKFYASSIQIRAHSSQGIAVEERAKGVYQCRTMLPKEKSQNTLGAGPRCDIEIR